MRRGKDIDPEREEDDGLNIISGDDDEDGGEDSNELFAIGQQCDKCKAEEGRVGIDPTCRGSYDGEPVLLGANCLALELKKAYQAVEGAAVIVEPFGDFSAHYYYRIDEMPAYRFVREDTEGISWQLLTVGGACERCGQQSRFAWMPAAAVEPALPEDRSVFRNIQADLEQLCGDCAATELARAYLELELPLITAEVPRSAMGIVIPTSD